MSEFTETQAHTIYEREGDGFHVEIADLGTGEYEVAVYEDGEITSHKRYLDFGKAKRTFHRAYHATSDRRKWERKRAAFYEAWDGVDEVTQAALYPYLQDDPKLWLDQRGAAAPTPQKKA